MAELNVNVESFVSTGGRIAHIRETGGRVVTVAYVRDYDSNMVQYGATIYRPGTEVSDSWNRKESNQLAVLRATEYPVSIPDDESWTGLERKEAVRRAMYTNGVSHR